MKTKCDGEKTQSWPRWIKGLKLHHSFVPLCRRSVCIVATDPISRMPSHQLDLSAKQLLYVDLFYNYISICTVRLRLSTTQSSPIVWSAGTCLDDWSFRSDWETWVAAWSHDHSGCLGFVVYQSPSHQYLILKNKNITAFCNQISGTGSWNGQGPQISQNNLAC